MAAAGAQGFGFDGGLGDLFEAFFGSMAGTAGRGRRRGPQPGADAEVTLQLEFAEAAFGARKELGIRLPVTCGTCGGNGAEVGTEPTECPDCQGTGEIRRIRQSLLGQVVTAVACGRCQGIGEIVSQPCQDCRGEGRRMEDRSFAVEVPAGVEHGSTLRLADRGPAGPRGGPNGSLFVHLAVAADERFERAGDDLHTALHVGVAQAALGAQLDVETLEEPRPVTVAPATQNGHVVRLKGLGIPHLRGRGRGDLFVHVAVDTPTTLTPRQEELLRRAGGRAGRAGRRPRGARRRPLPDPFGLRLTACPRLDLPSAGVVERAAAAAQVLVDDPADPAVGADDRHHLARVLRLRAGEPVVATDGRGHWSLCRYRGDEVGRELGAILEPDGPVTFEPAPSPGLTVAFAPAKGDRPEWVVQKLTELGIDRIVPLAAARSVVRWDGRPGRPGDRPAAPGGPRGGRPVPTGLAARGNGRTDRRRRRR